MSGFFHTLVVFGASASLAGCGAKVSSNDGEGSSGPHGGGRPEVDGGASTGGAGASPSSNGGVLGAGGRTGSGGRPGAGGLLGTGGRLPEAGGTVGTGGVVGTGGATSTGGSAGAGGMTLPDPGTLAQWSCTGLWRGCEQHMTETGYQSFYGLDTACPVDKTRPRSESDCTAEQLFECARATIGGVDVVVDCRCVPASPDGACDSCMPRGSGRLRTSDEICNGRTKTCGCVTGILIR